MFSQSLAALAAAGLRHASHVKEQVCLRQQCKNSSRKGGLDPTWSAKRESLASLSKKATKFCQTRIAASRYSQVNVGLAVASPVLFDLHASSFCLADQSSACTRLGAAVVSGCSTIANQAGQGGRATGTRDTREKAPDLEMLTCRAFLKHNLGLQFRP